LAEQKHRAEYAFYCLLDPWVSGQRDEKVNLPGLVSFTPFQGYSTGAELEN
jgi:hypothetical protein